jgi:hypothetical protein
VKRIAVEVCRNAALGACQQWHDDNAGTGVDNTKVADAGQLVSN